MKLNNHSKPIQATSLLLVFVLFSFSISVLAQTDGEFDYLPDSKKGPSHWGDLKPEWAACKNGKAQSPVDLPQSVKATGYSGDLHIVYKPTNATLKNRGHDIMLEWKKNDAGSIRIDGNEYYLQQCHWHTPSEHTIDGSSYDMELHTVHSSLDPNVNYKTAVIGRLYRLGEPDAFLSKLVSTISSIADSYQEREMGMIDPKEIQIDGKEYYRYLGSLSTPPCSEGVIWTIDKEIKTVSSEQVLALQTAVQDYAERNARPEQPLNGREIQLYGPIHGRRI